MSYLIEAARARRSLPSPDLAKAIRRAAGVTQAEVAAELGVDPLTVYRWEAGRRRPRGRYAEAYSALLNQLREVP
jgi:DNA-binding transcriptional regulator YiaG